AVEFSRNGRFLRTHHRTLSEAFLRALPFGVSSLADLISFSATRWSGLPVRFSASANSLSGLQDPISLFPFS
ncbi:hypothetical protein AB0J25_29830, partial [Streptomyces sp. NPDC049910]|uniref:hypothetical protein n=1 Tax=Streptomyces sp. NPDC049910 TaxID=3155278 RepID=UPI0034479BBD